MLTDDPTDQHSHHVYLDPEKEYTADDPEIKKLFDHDKLKFERLAQQNTYTVSDCDNYNNEKRPIIIDFNILKGKVKKDLSNIEDRFKVDSKKKCGTTIFDENFTGFTDDKFRLLTIGFSRKVTGQLIPYDIIIEVLKFVVFPPGTFYEKHNCIELTWKEYVQELEDRGFRNSCEKLESPDYIQKKKFVSPNFIVKLKRRKELIISIYDNRKNNENGKPLFKIKNIRYYPSISLYKDILLIGYRWSIFEFHITQDCINKINSFRAFNGYEEIENLSISPINKNNIFVLASTIKEIKIWDIANVENGPLAVYCPFDMPVGFGYIKCAFLDVADEQIICYNKFGLPTKKLILQRKGRKKIRNGTDCK